MGRVRPIALGHFHGGRHRLFDVRHIDRKLLLEETLDDDLAQGAMNPTGLQRSNGVAMLQSLLRQPLHPLGSRRSTQHVAVARRMRKLSVDVRFRQLTQIKG
jgi:hypothetical protein